MAIFHRIVKWSRAATALDGEGARIVGGRWNPPGVAVAYLSESRALSALEVLVHWGRDAVRMRWALVSAELPEDFIETPDPSDLPTGWDAFPSAKVSQDFGANWAGSGRSLAIRLPSAVIPEERNLMINVNHPDFPKLRFHAPQAFLFDRRLG